MINTHLYGNLAGLLVSLAVLFGVIMLAWGRPGTPANPNRATLRLMWFVVGLLALASVIFRAVILIAG